MPSENFWLKSRLQALKRSGLSEDVFIAILLCLISTNKHLILTARSEDLDDLRSMTEQVKPRLLTTTYNLRKDKCIC